MEKSKQDLTLMVLACGKYKFCNDGCLYSYRKGVGEWRVVKGNVLPGGYIQYILFGGRGKALKVVVYGHVLSYLYHFGPYDDNLVINHKDLNKLNNAPGNLEAVSVSENVVHSYGNNDVKKSGSYCRLIRYEEIQKIKEFMALGWSKARIARELDLDRVNVTRVVNKIKRGELLKYENPGPYKSPASKEKVVAGAVVLGPAYLE